MKTDKNKIAELKKLAYDYVYNVTRRNFFSANNDFENRNYHEDEANRIKRQLNLFVTKSLITSGDLIMLIQNTTVTN